MSFLRGLVFLSLLVAGGAVQGEEFTAKVIAVLDGDTVLVLRNSAMVKIRLAGIDAPEVSHAGMGGQSPNSQIAQPFGETSRLALANMVLRKQVRVSTQAVDKYGRMVAHLELNGLDINAEQVRRGMAWEYSYFHSNRALFALQEEARQAARGLWASKKPMPPWEWRKLHADPPQNPPSSSHAAANGVPCKSLCNPRLPLR